MNFPDRIFAVGGAGKEIALTVLETEWIIEELLRPRPDPASLTVTIMDSAEGEQNADRQRIAEIEDRIAETESELRDPSAGRTGSIDVQYKMVTDSIMLSSSIDLLGDDAVPRIAAGNGMEEENWWLDESYINENLDFAKGVVRKRGLGKAIYYKAYAEDDSISRYTDLPEKGKVAILGGLGGGTGSGIIMDLARQLKEKQRTAEITLFGILPNHTEGLEESTNALAALSELEHLSLTEEPVFKDTILIPIDPTDFDGKTGDRIKTEQFLQELDESVVYLLTSYYNTQGLEDPFADSPRYAPFTIGIPQVLRYRVEAINDAREGVRETLNAKEEAQRVEDEIYSSVRRFVEKHYDTDRVDPGVRDLDEADLRDRLNDVKEIIDLDLFRELNYESIAIFEDIIDDSESESDSLTEQIDIMSTSLRAVDTSGEVGTFVDDIDEHLAELLERELSLIGRKKDILVERKAIDDKRVREAVEFLLGAGDGASPAGVRLSKLETRLEDLEEQQSRVETDLSSTVDELEEIREEQSDKVERQLTEWEREASGKLEELRECDAELIDDEVRQLQGALEEFGATLSNAETSGEIEGVDSSAVRQHLETIEAQLDAAGIPFDENRRDIEGSITALKRARTAHIKINQDESLIEGLTPWESDSEQERQEGQKDFRMQKNTLDDNGVFEVGLPTDRFTVNTNFSGREIVERVEQRRDTIENETIDAIRSRTQNLSQERVRSFRSTLSERDPSIEELREIARDALWDDVSATDDIEERKEELEAELADIERELDVYQPTIELFQDLNSRREVLEKHLSEYQEQRAQLDTDTDQTPRREDDYVYVKQIKPSDVFRTTGTDDIADSDISHSREESQRIQNNLDELARNARNQQYTGLQRRKLSHGKKRYDDLRIRVAFMSRAIDQLDSDALDFEDTFSNAFNLGRSGNRNKRYTTWKRDIGGPWDIGFSVFIDGVFLDNIRKVVQADGYFNGYTEKAAEGGDILVHHSYGLEDGYHVRRNSLLNMEDPEDVGFYLRDESNVIDDLLSEYSEQVQHD